MKKLILLLLFIPLVSFGQIKEFNSDEELLVFDDGQKYNSTKVYYSSKYSFQRDQLSFKNGYQSVYIKINRIKEFGDLYEKGMKLGAYGGKLLGAGSGGFMCFIVDKNSHQFVRYSKI